MDLAIHVFLFDIMVNFHAVLQCCVTFAAKRQVYKRLDQAVLNGCISDKRYKIIVHFYWVLSKKFILLSHKSYHFKRVCWCCLWGGLCRVFLRYKQAAPVAKCLGYG